MNIRPMAIGVVVVMGLLLLVFRAGRIHPESRSAPGAAWEVLPLDTAEDLVGVGGSSESSLYLASREGGLFVLNATGEIRDKNKVDFVLEDLAIDPDGRPWIAA